MGERQGAEGDGNCYGPCNNKPVMSCRLEIGGEHDGLLAEGRQNGVIEVFANIKDRVAIKELGTK